MPENDFDPYYKWLGIPPSEQPPNHYRLLGLQLFEADPDVIANATDRQMAHIRTFQTGKHAALSQRLLNEFATAKVCLLRPEKKAEYDRALRAGQAAPAEAVYEEAIYDEPDAPVDLPQAAPVRPVTPQPAAKRVPSGSSPNLNRPRPAQPAPGQAAQPAPVRPTQPAPGRPTQPAPVRPMQPVAIQPAAVQPTTSLDPAESLAALEMVHSATHARRVQKSQSPLSNPLVIGGGVGGFVLLLIIVFAAFRGGGDTPPVVQATQHATDATTTGSDTTTDEPSTPQTPTGPTENPATPGGTPASPPAIAVTPPTTPVKPASTTQPQLLRFAAGDHIEIKNSANLVNLSQPFTAEMWVRLPSTPSTFGVLGTRSGVDEPTGWLLAATRTPQQLVDFGFSTALQNRTVTTPFKLANLNYAPTWHHVVLCAEGTSVRLMLDGNSLMTGFYDRNTFAPGTGDLVIGVESASSDSTTSGLQLRAFRLSSGVRYATAFKPQSTLLSDAQTLVLYDFSPDAGKLLADLSGHGHDGQIVGGTWISMTAEDMIAGPPATIAKNFVPQPVQPVKPEPAPANPSTPATPVAVAEPANNKLSPPANADLSKARALVRELFQADIGAAKTPEDKARLAQSLLTQSEKTTDDTTAQYALCLEALPLGIEGSNWPLVLQIIDSLDRIFKVDALGMKTDALVSISKLARTPLAKQQIIVVGLEGIDMAIAAERNDLATKLITTLQTTAVDVRDPELRRRVATRASELRKAQQEWVALNDAAAQVKAKPNDATANLTYGKILCLSKGRWDEGLPHLAKSGDAALVEAAQKDLSKPTTSAERIKAGDLWWALAEADKTTAKAEFERRAGFWYEQGVAELSGLSKIKIEKRLETVRATASAQGLQDQSITVDVGPGVTMPLRLIRAGEVQSLATGANIRVDAPFYMGSTEVTQAQWMAIIGFNPSRNQTNLAGPVDHVTFDEVTNFLDQLSQRNGNKYRFRLPTPTEWEYACRAGANTTYFFGADETRLREYAWINDNSSSDTHPVGQLKPNAFGLYDMLGNVREMCAEKDQPIYSNRGGGYSSSGMSASCSASNTMSRTSQQFGVGFRVVCDAGPARTAVASGGAASSPTPAVSTTPATPAPASTVATPSGSMPGMIGSVVVNGQKSGIAITYTPGKSFRQQSIDDELRKLNLIDPNGFSRSDVVAMTGTIRVTKETPTLMWLATGDNFYTTGVTVTIDGQKVADYRDSSKHNGTNRISLRRGDHTVVWQLSGGNIGDCALQFIDADTKQPLTMFYSKEAALAKNNARSSIDQATEVGLPVIPTEMR